MSNFRPCSNSRPDNVHQGLTRLIIFLDDASLILAKTSKTEFKTSAHAQHTPRFPISPTFSNYSLLVFFSNVALTSCLGLDTGSHLYVKSWSLSSSQLYSLSNLFIITYTEDKKALIVLPSCHSCPQVSSRMFLLEIRLIALRSSNAKWLIRPK